MVVIFFKILLMSIFKINQFCVIPYEILASHIICYIVLAINEWMSTLHQVLLPLDFYRNASNQLSNKTQVTGFFSTQLSSSTTVSFYSYGKSTF